MKKLLIFILSISLIILFSCSDTTTEPENSPPTILSITANPSILGINEIILLTCLAKDVDGDSLTYTWSSNEGVFPNGNSSLSVNWETPKYEGNYIVKVSITDIKETIVDSITFNVIFKCGGKIDYAGKTYNTIQIGNQCWFKENLDVGIMINRNDNSIEQTDNSLIEKFCYNNEEDSCNIYGGLYQWDEVMQYDTSEGTQGICPDGWHIPTYAEFQELINFVDKNGNVLKIIGQGESYNNSVGTNTTGFSALLAGHSTLAISGGIGHFNYLNKSTFFWSSKENFSTAYQMSLGNEYGDVSLFAYYKTRGFSVRCIKD